MKTVFFDVDTQLDFLYPAGALYVPGAETIVPALIELTRFAARHKIPIVSTMDAHAEDDSEFRVYPPHCVVGTQGQQKAAGTLGVGAEQHIVEKQKIDCFSNPELRPLLARLGAERYVVYGVATELCVRCAALGLIETGARVEIVSDAVMALSADAHTSTVAQFQQLGGAVTTVQEVLRSLTN